MSAQAVTRALRDGKKSVGDRAQIAGDLLSGSVFGKNEVFLPGREMVVLQWVFDLLHQDQKAREEPAVWNLLVTSWNHCDPQTGTLLLQQSRFSQILVSSIARGPIDEIDLAVGVLSQKNIIRFSNDQQASGFIFEFYKRRIAAKHIEELIDRTVATHPKLFKGQVDLLPLLVDTRHLQEFLSAPGVDCLTMIDEKSVPRVFTAIVASGVDVQSRFQWLAKKFPHRVHSLLEIMTSRLDKSVVETLVEDQLKTETPDWPTVVILLNMHTEPVFERAPRVLEKLLKHWDEGMALSLLAKYTQGRRLSELLVLLSQSFPTKPFEDSYAIIEALISSLKSLSTHQIVGLLKGLQSKQWLCLVMESLSYQSISREAKDTVVSLTSCFRGAYAAKGLYPEAEITLKAPKKADFVYLAYMFRLQELSGEKIEEKRVLKWKPEHPSEARVLLGRFFPVIDTLSTEAVSHLVSNVDSSINLLGNASLLETTQVFPQLVAHAIEASDVDALDLVPIKAVNRSNRDSVFKLAWAAAHFPLLTRCLDTFSKSHSLERGPSDLLKMLQKSDSANYGSALKFTQQLMRNDEFSAKAQAQRWKLNSWQELLVASCLPEPDMAKLSKVAKSNLEQGSNVGLSLAVLDMLGVDVSELDVSDLAIKVPSPEIFSVLCRQRLNWQVICAYFVYTGCKYEAEFDEFLRSLDQDTFLTLVATATSRHFGIVKAACPHFGKDRKYVAIYTRMMVELQANFDTLTESELVDLLSLCEYVLREHAWLVDQYSLEATLKLVSRIASSELSVAVSKPGELYSSLCLVVSRILLFQRYRLHGRMPLIIATLTQLLGCLANKRGKFAVAWSAPSVASAGNFARLISNLCNPPQHSVRETAGKNSLTSSVAKARRYVAQHVGVLIGNFVFLALQAGLDNEIRAALQPAYFAMMDTVGVQDFMSVTASLDGPGRAYLKPIYEEYKATGKWTKD